MVDGVEVVYCDSNMKRAEPKQGWMKKLMKDDPKHMDWYTEECRFSQHFFSSTIGSLMQHSNKTEVLPSVSLLQKTPSSPVSCHATGFYPERASLIWRKDGEELYEDVDHGEILPNHDGTFQMSIDLELSSVQPEDWRRYDCVFQPSGVKDNLVTRLDKAVIRTNREEHFLTIFFTGLYRVTNFPEFVGVVMVDGVEVVYCDSNMKRAEPKQGWMKKLMKDDPKHMDWYTEECRFSQHFFSSTIGSLMQHSNKTEVLPSVSLLQKTSSSPVSCHATGFYPERASLIWRKDGEELYEDVDHGEILPNHDGTFQMSIDLKLSSVQPEDWRRYDCVFQPSGVKDNLVTRLDKAVIRTNRGKNDTNSPLAMW
ncbi:uncharacterized protein ABDE67_015998 [Symphorus nematophorus]